jgi:LDH2 family malate/lactate/ureidoglycolate dehydrogenase
LFEHSDARAVIDADGGSVLFCGGQAVDLAYANAQQVNLSVVVLDDCRNRKLVMERLGNCGRRGMNCLAYWRDEGASPIEHVVSVAAGESLPDYRHYRVECRDGVDTRTLYIVCSHNVELITAHGSRYLREIVGAEVRVPAAQLALSYNASLDQGLAVNEELRASLNRLIEKILVESTDLTVLGAE